MLVLPGNLSRIYSGLLNGNGCYKFGLHHTITLGRNTEKQAIATVFSDSHLSA